jgi:hypothetical protein
VIADIFGSDEDGTDGDDDGGADGAEDHDGDDDGDMFGEEGEGSLAESAEESRRSSTASGGSLAPTPDADPVSAAPVAATGGAAQVEGVEASLVHVNGKLYLKIDELMGPSRLAVIKARTLALEEVIDVDLPEPDSLNKFAATSIDIAPPSERERSDGAGDDSRVNLAQGSLGASIRVASEGGTLDEATGRISFETQSRDAETTHIILLDLGTQRAVTSLGLQYYGAEDPGRTVELNHVEVEVSLDGGVYTRWGLSGETGVASIEIPAPSSEPVELRFARFALEARGVGRLNVGEIRAMGALATVAVVEEAATWTLASEGRNLIFLTMTPARSLNVVMVDPLNGFQAKEAFAVPGDWDSDALKAANVAANGENLAIFMSSGEGAGLAYKGRVVSLEKREFLFEKDLLFPKGPAAKLFNGFTYDPVNNLIWAVSSSRSTVGYWKNVGLPPRIPGKRPHSLDKLFSSPVPTFRLAALDEATKRVAPGDAPAAQAATILTHLDRISEVFGLHDRSLTSNHTNHLAITTCGQGEGHLVRMLIRDSQPISIKKDGVTLTPLGYDWQPRELANFEIGDATSERLLADFVGHLGDGVVVLVVGTRPVSDTRLVQSLMLSWSVPPQATRITPRANTRFGSPAVAALKRLGASEELLQQFKSSSDVFMMIGRKGAKTAVQSCVRALDSFQTIEQPIKVRKVPLSLDPSPQALNALISIILDTSKGEPAKDTDDDVLERVLSAQSSGHVWSAACLGALQLLTTHVHQLLTTQSPLSVRAMMDAKKFQALRTLLLGWLDMPSASSEGHQDACAESGLRLLTASFEVFYPTALEQSDLLVHYMGRYGPGGLTPMQSSLFSTIMTRMSGKASVLRVVQSLAASPSSGAYWPLLDSCMRIFVSEALTALQSLDASVHSSIFESATGFLTSFGRAIVTEAVQNIVIAPSQDAAQGSVTFLQEYLERLLTSSEPILDKVLTFLREHPQSKAEADQILRSSPLATLVPLVIFSFGELVRTSPHLVLHSATAMVKLLSRANALIQEVIKHVADEEHSKPEAAATPVRKTTTVTETMESEHPYRSNMDQLLKLYIPNAKQIAIAFDDQTRTEQNYDFLKFWKDERKTELWHDPNTKYSGRDGSENFPGMGGRAPLIINGDTAYVEWHTDGSREDWVSCSSPEAGLLAHCINPGGGSCRDGDSRRQPPSRASSRGRQRETATSGTASIGRSWRADGRWASA